MFSSKFIVAAAAFVSVVAGAAIERDATECYTTHTGVLQVDDADPYGLDPSTHIMIYPAGSLKLNVQLQACPKSTYASYQPDSGSYGARLVAVEQDGIGANQCLTMLASSSTTEYIYLHLATCGDDVTPPASQSFVLETNDFGHEITFNGQGYPEGVALDTATGAVETTSSTHQVKVWGAKEIGESYGTFVIQGYTGNE